MDLSAKFASSRAFLGLGPGGLRRDPTALFVGAAFAYAIAYGWAFLVHPWGDNGVQFLSDFGELPMQVLALGITLAIVLRGGSGWRPRAAWGLFALAVVVDMAGNALYGAYDLAGQQPFPSLADAFYLAFYPIVLLGLVTLPTLATREGLLRWRVWTNTLIVVLGGGMALIHFVVVPTVSTLTDDPLSSAISLAYPLGDLGLLAALGSIAARRPTRGGRWAIGLFSMAIAGWFFADFIFAIASLSDTWAFGGFADVCWLGGDLLFVLAARAYITGSRLEDAHEAAPVLPMVRWGPYVMLALGLGTLIVAAFAPNGDIIGVLAVLAAILVMLIVIRQVFEERERRDTEAALHAEQAAAAAALRNQAHHDVLTGLPNRLHLRERLEAEIGAARLTGRPVSLMFIDLNLFKDVNDTLGHAAGDELLIAVAARLTAAVRSADTVARLGGDEFAIVAPGASTAGALATASTAKAALEQPFEIAGTRVAISGSFGVATFPQGGAADYNELMRQADVAMYHAKREHLGPTAYDPAFDTAGNLSILTELRGAINGSGLHLLYQPWRDHGAGSTRLAEALVRWDHPTKGRLTPSDFLELASAAGLARDLDERVVTLACAQAKIWRQAGLDVTLSVNISRDALQDAGFGEVVKRILTAEGLPGTTLELEITEEGVLRHSEQAGRFVEQMRDLGVRMAIDDFGTGFSSLARLRDLRVGSLKIDQQFVRNALTEPDDAAIVEAVTALGHRLGLAVVAEGVEDKATLDYLDGLGVDFTQGYFISRPLEPEGLEAFLAGGRSARA